MGHIKEPDGVDFIINGKPLTDKERKAISEFIKSDKEKIARLKLRKAKSVNSKNRQTRRKARQKCHYSFTTGA